MTEWMTEHWFIEAVLTIVTCLILAKVLCVLADYMDRDQ
jgi:hypothetical protein